MKLHPSRALVRVRTLARELRTTTRALRAVTREWRNICPESRAGHLLSFLGASWWALLLFLPQSLFKTNISFTILARNAPEWQWGTMCLGVALLELVSLLGAPVLLRVLASTVSFVLWWYVALFLAQAAPMWHPEPFLFIQIPVSTGVGIYRATALVCAINVWMLTKFLVADVLISVGRLRRRMEKKPPVKVGGTAP